MKKSYLAVSLAALLICAAPCWAAEPEINAESEVGTTEFASSQQPVPLPAGFAVVVNGRTLPVDQFPHPLYMKNTAVMIPLKETAEALGYTVTWDNQKGCAHMDMSVASMDIYPYKDQYDRVGKLKNINLDMDCHYSAPADLWDNHLYVPAPMFRLFFNDVVTGSDAVAITVNAITLDGNTVHADENATPEAIKAAAGADKTPVEVVKGSENSNDPRGMWVGGPGTANPMREYDSITALQQAVDFPIVVPQGLRNKTISHLFTISQTIVDIRYTDGTMYRMAKGSEDISGDYNMYNATDSWTAGAIKVMARGDQGIYKSFIWQDGSYTYALSLPQGITKAAFMKLMQGE